MVDFDSIDLKPATYTFGDDQPDVDQAAVADGLERHRQRLNFHLNEFAAHRFGWKQAWERPDRNPMPYFAWWPLLDRPRRIRYEAGTRLLDAWAVLRHGARITDEDY